METRTLDKDILHQPEGRERTRGLQFQVPVSLHKAISQKALDDDTTKQELVVGVLREKFLPKEA